MTGPMRKAGLLLLGLWGMEPAHLHGQEAENPAWPRLARWLDPGLVSLEKEMRGIEGRLEGLARIPSDKTGERLGYHSRILPGRGVQLWVQVDLGTSFEFESVVMVPVVLPREQGGIEGYGFPLRFRVEASEDPEFAAPSLISDQSEADVGNPGRAPVVMACPGAKGRHIRITATMPAGSPGGNGQNNWPSLALAEILVLKGDRNLAAGRQVSAPTSREAYPVWSLENLTDGESILGPPVSSTPAPRKGWHSLAYPDAETPVSMTLDLGAVRPLDDVRLFPMRWAGYPHWLGFGFPVRYKVEGSMDEAFANSATLADFTGSDLPNPGMNAVILPANQQQARYVRVTSTRLWERFTDYAFVLSEIQVYSNGENVARQASVTVTSTYPEKPWHASHLIDGDASDNPILPLPAWVGQLQKSAALEKELQRLAVIRTQRLQLWADRLAKAGIGLVTLVPLLLAGFLVRNTVRRRRELQALQRRIARDLHDEVGSNLAGIALLSREGAASPSPAQKDALLQEMGQVADETAASMRDLVWMIQPGAPGDLVAGFRDCAHRLLAGLTLEFHPPVEALPSRLALDFKRQIYLIYKEALQNVARHSGARHVVIAMGREGRHLVVSVQDNGKGFSAEAPRPPGHGLDNMQHRAKTLKGTVSFSSTLGQGSEVVIRVPWS